MPTYPYACTSCEHEFDIIKRVAQIDDPEVCERCKEPARRYLVPVNFTGASDWDKAEYNPGLGCITKNRKHRERIAKSRGLIEVGNEPLDKYMRNQERRVTEDQDSAFEKAFEPMAYHLKEAMHKDKTK